MIRRSSRVQDRNSVSAFMTRISATPPDLIATDRAWAKSCAISSRGYEVWPSADGISRIIAMSPSVPCPSRGGPRSHEPQPYFWWKTSIAQEKS